MQRVAQHWWDYTLPVVKMLLHNPEPWLVKPLRSLVSMRMHTHVKSTRQCRCRLGEHACSELMWAGLCCARRGGT